MKKLLEKWYLIVIIGFLIFAGAVFAFFGKSSIIAIHDNLDLFVAQFQMLKNTGSFFSHGVDIPFLGGISRDNLPSELSLYSLLYLIMPSYGAYICGYLIKIVIAVISCVLLGKEWLGEEKYAKAKPMVYLGGFSYGILNLFPAFGIPFSSIPLAVYILLKIYRSGTIKKAWKWYIALFLYPFLSYFSYFGLFILAYQAVAVIWLSLRDKKFCGRLFAGLFVLGLGCVVFEYRLFGVMLFGDTETIRGTMVAGNYSFSGILNEIITSFTSGMMHAESVHTWLVMPVCIAYFFWLNIRYVVKKNARGIFHDLYNLFILTLVFNSVIYGIYNWEAFRSLIEALCPPLTGWQFNRTIFFSPFVWYAAFFLILIRMYNCNGKKLRYAANVLALLSVFVIILSGTRYNDLFATCLNKAKEIVKGKEIDQLSYEEFYSEQLFTQAMEDIDYQGEWSVAYGLHPAVLEYNGIATLDGYLGFYSQEYKENFRKIIAPALDRVEASRIYYDDWGARAYLYSGTDLSVISGSKNFVVSDYNLYIDTEAFKQLGGKYIFSKIKISNDEELGLILRESYEEENQAYTLYVYEAVS